MEDMVLLAVPGRFHFGTVQSIPSRHDYSSRENCINIFAVIIGYGFNKLEFVFKYCNITYAVRPRMVVLMTSSHPALQCTRTRLQGHSSMSIFHANILNSQVRPQNERADIKRHE